jgi:hypothetical protein
MGDMSYESKDPPAGGDYNLKTLHHFHKIAMETVIKKQPMSAMSQPASSSMESAIRTRRSEDLEGIKMERDVNCSNPLTLVRSN